MKTLKDIVIETILHYTVEGNPRSIVNTKVGSTTCLYNGPNGEKCTFARVCKEDRVSLLTEDENAKSMIEQFGRDVLKPEYNIEGADGCFWNFIQRIHDSHLDTTDIDSLLENINTGDFHNYQNLHIILSKEDLPGVEEWFENKSKI